MKNLLAILALLLAFPSYAVTECSGTVKQIAIDVGGSNRVYVVLTNGAGISLPQQGDTYKSVMAMASLSHTTGMSITFVFAADKINCATAGIRTDVVRVQTAEESSRVVN